MTARTRQPIGVLGAAALAGCAPLAKPGPPPAVTVEVAAEDEPAWRGVATAADELRLGRLDEAWTQGLAAAKRRFGTTLQREGALLDPAGALPRPAPPPGSYHCRLITLGGKGAALATYKPFFCYVEAEGDVLTFVKQTGSQRPAGRIYADEVETRQIFLGTLALGNEKSPLPYGEKAGRDLVGIVERVAPFRYRLVMPFPRPSVALDVYELVPALP